jgi:hypothetical protein
VQRVPKILSVAELTQVTFYQWSALEACALKGLVGSLRLDIELPVVPPSRATLVGRFHHKAMELAATVNSDAELDAGIESAIRDLQVEVNQWPHLRKVGSASGWGEVNASASLAIRIVSAGNVDGRLILKRTEQVLHSSDHVLVGKPDYFAISSRQAYLREHKSGPIRESDGQIMQVHLDQLHYYAALILDNYNVDSVVGRLESLNGDTFDTVVGKGDAAALKARASSLVTAVNERIRTGIAPAALATSSAEACSFCTARIICPTFKREQDRLGLEGDQYLVEGRVTRLTHSANGAVVDLSILDEFRKVGVTIGIPSAAATEISSGQRCQLSSLRRRGTALEWGHTSRASYCE